ncbi:MAG: BNR-4 repeat-containing protein [Candidatus Babeliales bacterium]|nr:BNR-4 repeat-containing protein [Candidatus Babeliales bacterium]
MQYTFQSVGKAPVRILQVMISIFLFNQNYADILDSSVEFSVYYNSVNGPTEPYTPLVNYNGKTYLVWLDVNFRPFITQKIDETLTTVPLDANPDYKALNDGHHRFSMGIDKNGYLHITGDMHYYPNNEAHLPMRYQNQTLLYWISNQPYDISAGFSFAGGLNAPTAIPGKYFVFGHFFHDNYGELYYTAMVRAYLNPNHKVQGELGIGLYKYDASKRIWNAIGGPGDAVFPTADPATALTVFYWENAGQLTPGWFQVYQPSFAFDNNNHLHFAVAGQVDMTFAYNTRLLYATSPDGGVTWYRANGTQIAKLPLRGVDSSPSCADVVVDTKGTYTLGTFPKVVADQYSNSLVTVDTTWQEEPIWHRWNGANWTNDVSNGHQAQGYSARLGLDNNITFIGDNGGDAQIWLRRTSGFNQYSSAYFLPLYLPLSGLHYFECISDIGLKTAGSLYGVGINDSNLNTIQVVKLIFAQKQLPLGWAHQDIGSAVPLGGAADYDKGAFILRSCGSGIGTNTDMFQYVYHPLVGDGTIIARVASQDAVRQACTDGIMMRETLAQNSACAAVGISTMNQLLFSYRTASNANAGVAVSYNIAAPCWIKLVRTGNVFTAFNSIDGFTWVQNGSQVINMAANIYVGLMSSSQAPLTQVHSATIDNVKIQ